jgi:HlyD family secretion protein
MTVNKSESQPEAKAVSQTQPAANAGAPADLAPQIAKRAYEIHEERGHQSDSTVRDWEQAEKEVRRDQTKGKPPPGTKIEPKPETKGEPTPDSKTEPSSSTKKKVLVGGVIALAVFAILAIGFGLGMRWRTSKKVQNRLVLYGNVDLRQIDLSFNNSERIAEVLFQEGDKVKRGQILARLDTRRLKPQTEAAEAEMESQQSIVQKLHHGSRPEEVAQAQANVASAKADQVNASLQWRRVKALSGLTTGKAVSQQDLDSAKAALDSAEARLAMAQKGLDLSVIGPRAEDIAQGEAQLRVNQAQLDLLRQKLADAELVSPSDAVVRSRLLEPGEMITPQRAVYNLAITNPKWVRAYVSDPDLGKIHPGMKASIGADSFPGRAFSGWVGFISSVAEFTPKSVETVELRSSLVYEIRVFVEDPQDEMRLGMPATVSLELNSPAPGQQAERRRANVVDNNP